MVATKTKPKQTARQRISELKARLDASEVHRQQLGDDCRTMFTYLMRQCEALQRSHGIKIEAPEPCVFVVTVERREFKTRVEALEYGEKLAALLDKVPT